jgi:hypothetical protein
MQLPKEIAMTSRERKLIAEIKLLKKRLRENEELMWQTAMKVEDMLGAVQTLNGSLKASKAHRVKRSKRNQEPALRGVIKSSTPPASASR